jgi:hypothetical protein
MAIFHRSNELVVLRIVAPGLQHEIHCSRPARTRNSCISSKSFRLRKCPSPKSSRSQRPAFPRYNQPSVSLANHTRLALVFFCSAVACFIAGCTAAFGPGYGIDKQEIRVQFLPAPEPVIRIDATYNLRNTGDQPLSSLEIRLPGRRRPSFANPRAEWDAAALAFSVSPDNDSNVLLSFPRPWQVAEKRALHLSFEYHSAAAGGSPVSFTSDAFFLSAQGWSPELLPARGMFATGGTPPDKWNFVVRIPDGFLVHMSGGRAPRISRSAGVQTLTALQRPADGYPFVVAGRFTPSAKLNAGSVAVNLWTRSPQSSDDLNRISDALVRTIRVYSSMFGSHEGRLRRLWVVECPSGPGCFTGSISPYGPLISGQNEKISAEMASLDTVMVDFTADIPQIALAAAPALAASWLGYDRNPGFFEQDPPLSALPAFAVARGRESLQGPEVRTQIIRRALANIPQHSVPGVPENDLVVRAKSLLFFYGLQDLYGPGVFDRAVTHMLYARQGLAFDLDDLIAAFEQETPRNCAEFVRHWMKRPGVPQEFRARYENSANAGILPSHLNAKENNP